MDAEILETIKLLFDEKYASIRFQAVISHDEALHYHNLIDHEPASPTFTIYSGYNASRLKKYRYKPFFVKKEFLNLGKETVKDCFGNSVPMYDLERTICDLFRNRSSFEIQDFTTAVKSYARRKDRNIPKLYEYAGLMFSGTGGMMQGTPDFEVTYYTNATVV